MSKCTKCKTPIQSGTICAPCQMKYGANKVPVAQAVIQWGCETQSAAKKVEVKSDANLKDGVSDFMKPVMACITENKGAKKATNFGDQGTLWTHKKHTTTSLDFQGIRQGTSNSYWIDLQGQVGKGEARKTYCQVMILAHNNPPPESVVKAAFELSLEAKTGAARIVVFPEGEVGRPL